MVFNHRLGITGLCILIIVFQTTPLTDCHLPFIVMAVCTITGTASNSFMFLLRVRAVYSSGSLGLWGKSKAERMVVCVFGVWWLAVVGTTMLYSFGVQATHRGGKCGITAAKNWSTASLWVNAGYDTSIFVAISARIVSYTIQPSLCASHILKKPIISGSWAAFANGNGLSRLCKELLRGGQLYYW